MKRFYTMLLLLLPLLIECGNIDRDNPLDPKNPHSRVERAVLVELFVNDSTGYDFCRDALAAIEQISEKDMYRDRLFILEYHLYKDNWDDPYALTACNKRYDEYVPPNSDDRGIPDAFFNGMVKRVQGASPDKIEYRYLSALEDLMGKDSYFTIEADKNIADDFIALNVRVARLGNSSESNVSLRVVLYEDLGIDNYRFVVRKILPYQSISKIKSGEIKSFDFSEQVANAENINEIQALIFLQDQKETTREVYQVAKF